MTSAVGNGNALTSLYNGRPVHPNHRGALSNTYVAKCRCCRIYAPRKRLAKNEIIVDNDDAEKSVCYKESATGRKWTNCDSVGFANKQNVYSDGENPFRMGTARKAKATKRKKFSQVSYQPRFPEEGKYAVYVSYQTVPKSVSDARYIVYHKGEKQNSPSTRRWVAEPGYTSAPSISTVDAMSSTG